MIRYRYAEHGSPPAPFVFVTLFCPEKGTRIENQSAKFDTGAERSVLPEEIITALELVEDGRLRFQGLNRDQFEIGSFGERPA